MLVSIDNATMNFFVSSRTDFLTPFAKFFTYLGNWQFLLPVAAIAGLIIWRKRGKRLAAYFLAFGVLGEAVVYSLKNIVERARPDQSLWLIAEDLYESFPSGHATMSLLIYGMLACVAADRLKKRQARTMFAVTAMLVLVISLSRLYLGVHWSSDIVSGWAIGGVLLIVYNSKLCSSRH